MKARQSSSLRSVRSRSTREQIMDLRFYQTKLDFEKELCEACCWYDCPGVHVEKSHQNDDYYKALKPVPKKVLIKRTSMAAGTLGRVGTPAARYSKSLMDDVAGQGRISELIGVPGASTPVTDERQTGLRCHNIHSIYDAHNELVELLIPKATDIPRVLMQCITLLSPHFRYLTKFSIVKSRLNGYALLELKNMVRFSHLTEIVLDESVLLKGTYAVLLENTSKLRYLSLVRCGVTDEMCMEIASKITATISPVSNLALLNLSSNQISDAGVKSLGQALKTNRSLRYLNLANNRITDEGALPLLDVLMEFPLTNDDIVAKQNRYCVYLKGKLGAYKCSKAIEESETKSMIDESIRKGQKSATPSLSSKKTKKEGNSSAPMSARADSELRPFNDPFSPERLKFNDDVIVCIGNFVLCYLNLSYNNLSYLSVKKLETVMFYQSIIKKPTDLGLMKVLLDGNPMPENCAEYNTLNQLMSNTFRQSQLYDGHVKRKNVMQRISKK